MTSSTHKILSLIIIHVICVKAADTVRTTEEEQQNKEVYYAKLIDYLFENYPDFISRLLTYNGTNFGLDSSIRHGNLYHGYTLETKYKDGYGILLADSYKEKFRSGIIESSPLSHNVLYKCTTAVHYCTGNPSYCFYDEGVRGTHIIIVAGHGGPLRPKSIPNRGAGCWNKNTEECIYSHDCENTTENIFKSKEKCDTMDADDVATTDIAESLVHSIQRRTGYRPHLIVNRVHRSKIDVNRDIELGTFKVAESEQVYKDFHRFIRIAKQSFEGKRGIIIDIHGNSRGPWTMLGYGMYKYQFENHDLDPKQSSIRHLAKHAKRSNVSFEDLLRGRHSLGYFLDEVGVKVFPSPNNPSPLNKGYLTGGYITTTHGSKHGGNVDAIQVEIPTKVRNKPETENVYISKLTQALIKFININYNQNKSIIIAPDQI